MRTRHTIKLLIVIFILALLISVSLTSSVMAFPSLEQEDPPKPEIPDDGTPHEGAITLDLSQGTPLPGAKERAGVEDFSSTDTSPIPMEGSHTVDPPAAGWVTIMSEDPNGDFPTANGWVVADDNSYSGEDYWGDVNCHYYTASWSIWAADIGNMTDCGHYDNDMLSWMVYGPFNLSDAYDAEMLFYYWYDTEPGYDAFGWYASSDGYNFDGWYVTGSSSQNWYSENFDISSYIGDSSVWIAFVFGSDYTENNYEGAYVDAITLRKYTDPPVPNLAPYTPSGWDYPIVPSSVSGTTSVNNLYTGQNTYIDWATANISDFDFTETFYSCLFLDIDIVDCWYTDGLLSSHYAYILDWPTIVTTEGWHTLTIVADYYNDIAETNESDNSWSHDFYWNPAAPADAGIEVSIGGVLQGANSLYTNQHQIVRYPVAGGPVVIQSDGANIIASELQLRREDITADFWTGIAHLMGVQEGRLSDKYVFPYYNGTDKTKYQSIQFGNYDTFSTEVTITIGGVTMGTYALDPSESTTKQYDVTGGPIVISSNNSAKIIASFYELKRPGTDGKWWGQTQMMGIPWSELSSTYVFPRYNDTLPGMDATLVFSNPSDQSASVTVTIGGVIMGTYATDPDDYHVVRYPVAGGPVVISSDGPNIIASELQLRRQDITADFWTGIAHLMGVQEERLADQYVFPYYNGTDKTKYQSIQFGNYDIISTEVTITIGGMFMGTYPLAPSESTTKQYEFTGGPIVISSNNSAKIIASFYELKRPGTDGKWWGQTQMMGIPWAELSNTYVFPRYNDTLPGMDATLIFSVP